MWILIHKNILVVFVIVKVNFYNVMHCSNASDRLTSTIGSCHGNLISMTIYTGAGSQKVKYL